MARNILPCLNPDLPMDDILNFQVVGSVLTKLGAFLEQECRLKDMPYVEYLKSEHWKRTRELALGYYGRACCLCSKTTGIQVHHRNYHNKGHETVSDLIVLCSNCHAKFHDKA
jgi:5-methylcytosine-specific restriction endonuclease McrA